jgi:hypothetical protein
MRAFPLILFAAVPVAFAQAPEASDAVEQALAATTDLAAVSFQNGDPLMADAALRAHYALANAAEALRASPNYLGPPLMDPVTFKIFYDELRRGTSSDKHANIARAGRRHLFSVAQLVSLMELFVMSDDRIRVAVTLYRRVADPEHFSRAYAALTFDTDRRRLALVLTR